MKRGLTAYAAALALAGCTAGADAPGDSALPGGESRSAWSGIGASEALHFTGTEPFWGGSASGTTLTWKTPERPDGVTIRVTRFAGRGGLGLTGTLDGAPFDMAVSDAVLQRRNVRSRLPLHRHRAPRDRKFAGMRLERRPSLYRAPRPLNGRFFGQKGPRGSGQLGFRDSSSVRSAELSVSRT